jgi:hypothetical protein
MRYILFFLLATATASSWAAPAPVQCERGIQFDGRYDADLGPLEARNAALLKHFGFNVYSAALYLEVDREPSTVLDAVPKALEIRYHRSISAEQIINAAEKVIERMPAPQVAAVRERLNAMYAAFVDVEEGDRYRLIYTPGIGSSLELNGEEQVVIPGEDFQRVFFGIWLSDVALSPKLRDRLLGLR